MISEEKTVAFDLDMTLVDSRPVSERALQCLVSEHGYDLDIDSLLARYGLPLSQWLPSGSDHTLFRALQMQEIAGAKAMPGAASALKVTRESGGRIVVVTAAPHATATEMLCAAGLSADALRADAWGVGKVEPLKAEGCWAFVGDHTDDMAAARQAGAIAVGVATGTSPPLGADVELDDLHAFAPWLRAQVWLPDPDRISERRHNIEPKVRDAEVSR